MAAAARRGEPASHGQLRGGVKTYLGVIGPLGLAFDVTAHLVTPSIDDTHVVISLGMLAAILR